MKEELFKKEEVLSLLKRALTRAETMHQVSVVSPTGEAYVTNQYYMITLIELLIKYQILVDDEQEWIAFFSRLQDAFEKNQEYKDFLLAGNQILLDTVQLFLKVEDQVSPENKRKILDYTYQKYIVEGYCFHGFLNSSLETVRKAGIYPNRPPKRIETMQQIEAIFKRHRLALPFGVKVKSLAKDYFELTDSPAMAYFYSLRAPEYFAMFTSQNANFKESEYDRNAYYRKDKTACSKNIENLITKEQFSTQEISLIMNYFNEEWDHLHLNKKEALIAFIYRKELGIDALEDMDQLYSNLDSEPLVYQFARIIDGRSPKIKRYTKVLPFAFRLKKLPSYDRLLHYRQKEQKKEPKVKVTEEVTVPNDHGSADIFALSGILLIALGITLMAMMNYFQLR